MFIPCLRGNVKDWLRRTLKLRGVKTTCTIIVLTSFAGCVTMNCTHGITYPGDEYYGCTVTKEEAF